MGSIQAFKESAVRFSAVPEAGSAPPKRVYGEGSSGTVGKAFCRDFVDGLRVRDRPKGDGRESAAGGNEWVGERVIRRANECASESDFHQLSPSAYQGTAYPFSISSGGVP